MNNKTLLLIFLVLLAIYGLTWLFSDRKESSFNTDLIAVDTAAVTSIVIDPKASDVAEFTLKRETNGWIATDGIRSVRAALGSVNSLLGNLQLIQTKRIVAKAPEKWGEYEVEEDNATRIRIYKEEKPLADFLVGRFNFNPQAQSGVSYLRLTGQEEVYAVDGFQALTFGQGFDSYRDRSFLKVGPETEILEFDFQHQDSAFAFLQTNGQWILNGAIPVDSAAMAGYLDRLVNVTGDQFADDFDEIGARELPQHRLTFRGNGIDPPIVITAYRDTTRAQPFVLQSSQRPETFFASDSSGLYKRLFEGAKALTYPEE